MTCLAWRMTNRVNIHHNVGSVTVLFHDGDTFRRVRAKFYMETWGTVDPEVAHREILPSEERRGLGSDLGPVVPNRLRNKVLGGGR